MALARARRRTTQMDYWPSFVDALTTLVLVIIFLLSIFAIAQFFLSQELSGRDAVLNRLNAQIAELTELLALERAQGGDLADTLALMEAGLAEVEAERDALQARLDDETGAASEASGAVEALTSDLEDERRISQRALSQVELLNQQISALRRQIAVLEEALDASEARDEESRTRIADLGRRLNVALAQRVQELARYRSDFFGRLRDILGDREGIQVVGDRFVFQSEVIFPSGSDAVTSAGEDELEQLAAALIVLEAEIPEDIDWVLRVDGHTDSRPLSGFGQFADNWELSSARAISVVKFLIEEGVSAERLVAAGFGEYQPLDPADGEDAWARNRRIELKLTER